MVPTERLCEDILEELCLSINPFLGGGLRCSGTDRITSKQRCLFVTVGESFI